MKRMMLGFGLCAAVMFAATPALAQRGHGGPPATHGQSGSHAPSTHGQSGTRGGGSSTHGQSGTHAGSAHGSQTTHGGGNKGGGTSTTTTKGKTTTTTTTTTGTTLSPAQQKLEQNTNLANKLSTKLNGADVVAAAAGFKNLGQFVAAVNVSNNLGIPFADLKTRMVKDGMSLGQAIHDLRPSVSAETEAKHAEADADALISQTTTTAKTKKKDGKQ